MSQRCWTSIHILPVVDPHGKPLTPMPPKNGDIAWDWRLVGVVPYGKDGAVFYWEGVVDDPPATT